jgi:putative transposase
MHYVLGAGWPGPSACRPAPTRHIIASSALERWSRTLKSECLRNPEYETPVQLEDMIRGFVDEYNTTRPHQSLGYATPSTWYFSSIAEAA